MTTITMPHWIDGAEVTEEGAQTIAIDNPATGEVVGHLACASVDLLDQAIASARVAQKEWAKASLAKRTRVMYKFRELLLAHQDRIAEIIVREGGKTRGDALGEIARGLEIVEFACGIQNALKGDYTSQAATGVDIHTVRQPVGIVAGICPFNFPMMVPMWMHPMALATGNAFIMKPASPVPTASLYVAKLYQEAGLPDGLFQVVCGDRVIVDAILRHPGVDAISFVGSTPVAEIVMSVGTEHGKRVQALGGANNHAIVMPDANLDFATQHIVSGAFGAAGQRCMALPVVVAVGGVGDALVEKVAERGRALHVGAGADPVNEMGPVISKKSRDQIVAWIDDAEAKGAKIVLDGRGYLPADEACKDGNWVGPTLVDHATPDLDVYKEEVFGPVLTVVRVDTYEEAVDLVNSGPFGNGAAIFTESGDYARRFTLDVEAGMVGVNVPIPVPVGYYSFGGWKDSLLGDIKIHGQEGVNFYTKAKVITTRWAGVADHGKIGLDFVATK